MVIKVSKRFGAQFPSRLVDGAIYMSGVESVSVQSDDLEHSLAIEHDIELGELRVLHITARDEVPECILSVLQ